MDELQSGSGADQASNLKGGKKKEIMKKLSDMAKIYAKSYVQLPYGREIEGTAELLLQVAEKLTEYEEIIDKLASYVVEKAYYCPVTDKYTIRTGCVGLRKPGCKECMLKHMEDFKIPPRITCVKIYEKD